LQRTVTLPQIAKLLGVPTSGQRARDVARLLRRHGWIRSLALKGCYEFQPAVGGACASGDPWLEFRMALGRAPGITAHVGLGSAALLRGFADRRNDPEVIVWSRTHRVPEGLETLYKVLRVKPERLFGTSLLDGTPVATTERIALEAAMWPQHAGDLRNPEHWLHAVFQAASVDELVASVGEAGPTATGRLGYLAERFGAASLARRLQNLPHVKPVWIGRRDANQRHFNKRWGVYDNVGVAGFD
jgi:AbiEi antitoxin C-terminal domain